MKKLTAILIGLVLLLTPVTQVYADTQSSIGSLSAKINQITAKVSITGKTTPAAKAVTVMVTDSNGYCDYLNQIHSDSSGNFAVNYKIINPLSGEYKVKARVEGRNEDYNASFTYTGIVQSVITPSSAQFDKNPSNQKDIIVLRTDDDNLLNSIKNGTYTLVLNTDYVVQGSQIIVSKAYLASLPTGNQAFVFDFTTGSDPVLSVTIIDTPNSPVQPPQPPVVVPPAVQPTPSPTPTPSVPTPTPVPADAKIDESAKSIGEAADSDKPVDSQGAQSIAQNLSAIAQNVSQAAAKTDEQKTSNISAAADSLSDVTKIVSNATSTEASGVIVSEASKVLAAISESAVSIKDEKSAAVAVEGLSTAVQNSAGLLSSVKDAQQQKELVQSVTKVFDAMSTAAGAVASEEKAVETAKSISSAISNADDIINSVKDSQTKGTVVQKTVGLIEAAKSVIEKIDSPDRALSAARDVLGSISSAAKNSNEAGTAQILKDQMSAVAQGTVDKIGKSTVETKVEGGKSAAVLSNDDAAKLIENASAVIAAKNQLQSALKADSIDAGIKTKVVIDAARQDGTSSVTATLPSNIMDSVKSKGIDKVEFSTGIAAVAISPDAISTKDTKSISIEVRQADTQKDLTAAQRTAVGNNPVFDFNAAVIRNNGTRSQISSFASPVEIRVPYTPAANQDTDKITVFFINDKGQLENKAGIYDPETQTVVFTTEHFSKYFVKENKVQFKDVAKNDQNKKYIEYAAAKGIMTAASKDKFMPSSALTRGEMASILVKIFKLSNSINKNLKAGYSDVKAGSTYDNAIAVAVKAGLMSGSGKKFTPNGKVTRQELAAAVAKGMNKYGKYSYPSSPLGYLTFTDISKIKADNRAAVAMIVKNGIMQAKTGKLFSPGDIVTRAEASNVVYRCLK